MELFSLIGLVVAGLAVFLGQHLEGGHFQTLINIPALLIVLGGTMGAVMIETPSGSFKRALKMISWLVFPPKQIRTQLIEKVILCANQVREKGFLGLESLANEESDFFVKKGLEMLMDGYSSDQIRDSLHAEIIQRENQELQAANVFESMGGYSPTLGILGAVISLIHVLGNLTVPDKLGSGIAVAFVATIYGIGLANLFFIPVAKKIKSHIFQRTTDCEMIIEGFVGISQGENPRFIQKKLESFVVAV